MCYGFIKGRESWVTKMAGKLTAEMHLDIRRERERSDQLKKKIMRQKKECVPTVNTGVGE